MIINFNQNFRLVTWLTLLLLVYLIPECAALADTSPISPPALEAATLLKIQPEVERLISTKGASGSQTPSDAELSLQLLLVRKILGGSLEVRKMADILDDELSSEYTAQDEMIASRNRGIALNNSINFTQNGTLGLIGGGIDYAGASNASNDMAIISGSTVLLLSSVALLQTRGGRRHSQSAPNMLGQLLSLDSPNEFRFSPLVWAYLNAVPPDSKNGMTRREQLIDHWKKAGVLTIKLNNQSNLDKVAACGPRHKERSETIKLITNRIKMLHDVHTEVESLDRELVDLLHALD